MKKYTLLFFISMLLMMLAACGSSNSDNDNKKEQGENDSITVEHELGETEVEKNPDDVVVFDYGILDTLDELNIDVSAVPQDNMPSYLDKYEGDDYKDVGSLKEPDFEEIARADPDLIIISGRQSDVYDELEEIAPTVYLDVDTERYIDSFKENMETVGEIFDQEEKVDQELEAIDESINELNDKAEDIDKSGMVLMASDTDVSVFGPESRFGLVHDVMGIPASDEEIETSTHGQDVSFEYVKEQDPDLLYVIDRGAAIDEGEISAKDLIENDLTEDTKAYKNDDIIYLNPEVWYLSGGGLVSTQEMIQEVSESLN